MSSKSKQKEDRRELKQYLKYGDVGKIAELAGVSPKTVSNYLQGITGSTIVGTYVEQFVAKRKQELEQKLNNAL